MNQHPLTPGSKSIPLITAALLLVALVATVGRAGNEMRFVPDVIGQFNDLSVRPDPLGFYRSPSPDPSLCKHYQGIVRVAAADGTPYFIVTRSGVVPHEGVCHTGEDDPGNLLVVRMGSRDNNGERLRSNRLERNTDISDTAPPAEDTTVNFFTYDGTVEGFPDYGHPGGMQVVDDVLVVALESPYDGGPDALFVFYDISDPEHPEFLSAFDPEEEGVKSGSAGITPLANGHYLLVVTGEHNETVWFYESLSPDGTLDGPPTDLTSPMLDWVLKDEWQPDAGSDDADYLGHDWPGGGLLNSRHQTLQFLREGDINGALYLAGARGIAGHPFADDIMDLYRVDFIDDQIRLKHVSSQVMSSHPTLDGPLALPGNNVANFAAASAFYVSPSGELLFYGTEHDNDGPNESVKAGEWRHRDMVRPGSPTLRPSVKLFGPYEVPEGGDTVLTGLAQSPITRAWIQLFSGTNFSPRSLVVDFSDWSKDSYDNFKDLDGSIFDTHFGFSDEPSSWRWFAPWGCSIRANDDDFGDGDFPGEHTRTLFGTGEPESDANLASVPNNSNSGSMDEEITSVQFLENCAEYYSTIPELFWDLDLSGFAETNGLIVTFPATGLDGPGDVEVLAEALHPIDETSGYATATVHVTNVAPTIAPFELFDSFGLKIGTEVPFAIQGLPVTAHGSFTDPGIPDHQTAILHWGDGLTDPSSAFDLFADALGGAVGHLQHAHPYAIAGDFSVELQVTDDDGGVDNASFPVEVLTPLQAVVQVVDLLDQLIAGTTSNAQLNPLQRARKALDGSVGGLGANGAVDKLEEGNTQAALEKLRQAIADLETARAAGVDVGTLIALLQQVVTSLTTA